MLSEMKVSKYCVLKFRQRCENLVKQAIFYSLLSREKKIFYVSSKSQSPPLYPAPKGVVNEEKYCEKGAKRDRGKKKNNTKN